MSTSEQRYRLRDALRAPRRDGNYSLARRGRAKTGLRCRNCSGEVFDKPLACILCGRRYQLEVCPTCGAEVAEGVAHYPPEKVSDG